MPTRQWIKEHKVVSIWKDNTLMIFGTFDDEQNINPFEPFKTGFDGFSNSIFNVFIPLLGIVRVRKDNLKTLTIPSILCAFITVESRQNNDEISENIFVLNWYVYRIPYIGLIITLSTLLTLFYE